VPDAEVVPEGDGAGSELVPHVATRAEVMRPLNSDELVTAFAEYQKLRGRLLTKEDYQDAGRGKSFVKKSGWRKIATAFGLNTEILHSSVERDENGDPTRAELWVRAIAPNGRYADGDGYCSVTEDRFSGPRGNKSKLENDLRGTAKTRATNRAISDLVGMGEVSAEEIGGSADDTPPAPQFGPEIREATQVSFSNAVRWLHDDQDLTGANAGELAGQLTELYGYLPQVSATAIVLLAKQIKDGVEQPLPDEAHPEPAPDEPAPDEPAPEPEPQDDPQPQGELQ
jgi:hypothetical protein